MIKNKKSCCIKQIRNGVRAIVFFPIGLISLLSFHLSFAGSPGEYAVIHSDPALEEVVKNNQLPPDYRYYYDGRSSLPYAVIGIDPNYKLISKYWYPIGSKDQVVNKVSHLMYTGATHITYARILDSAGNQIGLWFSEYQNTIVQFGPDNGLKIFSPYQPNEVM